jgi:mannose-6-phosphate isomerase-like protein (cupin superfamily)
MTSHPEFVLVGVLMKQHLSSKQTDGAFSLFENWSNGPSGTPIHVHACDDETLYMLEGTMGAIIAGEAHTISAGESIFLPRGIPHQLINQSGAPAHYLLLCTPGGFEGFLEEGGHEQAPGELPQPPSAADIERLKAAAPRYGITLLASWPTAEKL